MTRTRCYFCPHTATRNYKGFDICELHYARIDATRTEFSALAARDRPAHKVIDRIRLVGVLEEMLSADKVQEILGNETWFQQIQSIRARAKELQEIAQKPKLADFMTPRRETS